MVKQLQRGSISVKFDGLKKRESINNRIDGFPEVQRYLRWPLTTVCNNTALFCNGSPFEWWYFTRGCRTQKPVFSLPLTYSLMGEVAVYMLEG